MTNAHSIQSALTHATTLLKTQQNDTESATFEARILLHHVLNVNRAWLISHQNDALQPNINAVYRALINRRLNGEPIAYILGVREFYGLNLKVSADTLIPRPDTETLVEAALAKIALPGTPSPQPSPARGEGGKNLQDLTNSSPSPQRGRGVGERGETDLEKTLDSDFRRNDGFRILDLGTGSGAIALAIAKHRSQAFVLALDASQAALDVAIENAQSLKIPNVDFVLSDWFSALNQQTNTKKFDLIVSNPPYIEADDDHLNQGDLRFEPISALTSGQDGLDDIRKIIKQAPQYLKPQGWLLLEHGYNQAEAVATLLKNTGFSDIETIKDLAGINRVTLGRLC